MSPFSWGVEETWSMFQKYVHIILEKLVTGIVYGNMMDIQYYTMICCVPVASLSEKDLLNI